MTRPKATAMIYWDSQDPKYTGWAWTTYRGANEDSGPLDVDAGATDAELISAFRTQVDPAITEMYISIARD